VTAPLLTTTHTGVG